MTRGKSIGTGCRAVVLLMAASIAWGAPQDQAKPSVGRTWREPRGGYTPAEFTAYMAAHVATNPADRTRLLDDFVAKHPTSSLVPFAYFDYYQLYLNQGNYPKALGYLDKLMSLDETDLNAQLVLLMERASAFLMGCDHPELQTPEAYAAARDAAAQGQQALRQLQKPAAATDDQFAAQKKGIGMNFESVTRIAESGLKGDQGAACKPLPPPLPVLNPDPGRLERTLNGLKAEQQQGAPVR